MANAIDTLDNLVREELPNVIHECLPEIAPVYAYIKSTAIGVTRDTGIGRDWQVGHLYDTGLAGIVQPANPAGLAVRTNTNFPQSNFITPGDASMSPFPPFAQAPHVSVIKRVTSLQKMVGNFAIPITWKEGDALSASQISQVSRDIKAVGKLRALQEATSWFMSSYNALCSVDPAAAAANCEGYATLANAQARSSELPFTTGQAVTVLRVVMDAGTGNIQFFRPGMMVDLVRDSSGPVFGVGGTGLINDTSTGVAWGSTYIPLVISAVDYINEVIYISTVNGGYLNTDTTTQNIGTTQKFWIVTAGGGAAETAALGREMWSWGPEDWLKSSGTILQRAGSAYYQDGSNVGEGISLTTYPQFQSVLATVSAPLTEQILNRYVGGYLNAYPGASLDTFITTMGVTMKFLEQPSLYNNRMMHDRTGKTLKYAAGWDEVSYSFNGRSMNWIIAPMCIAGRLYGMKFAGDNIKRYVPPSVGGKDGAVADVEFLAPLGGHSSIFMVGRAATSAAPCEVLEAPFWQYNLVLPIDVRGVKLSSITEATFAAA